ncbi:hypothetical protein BU17DRAFT_75072 [Hysterangium stoloniferum]|nr:hypothetical protein BU17DRAFT_75072 [Hysterangium stoloniferum]
MYDGKECTFDFYHHDPWQWILSLVTDATLAKHLIWYPVKKYLHDGDIVTQLYDDIDSGKSWWDIQINSVLKFDLPHCFLPLHIWLDKGKVSTTVKLHPALLRSGFLPGDIRKGSGNGGAVLFLMMPVRSIYHKVLRIALQPLQRPSLYGEAVTCSDYVQRSGSYNWCHHPICWGASALHPCPRCLVHKDELTKLTKVFSFRTTQSMLDIINQARMAKSKKKGEEILQDNGLHINAFWTISNSDPYSAVSYDTLHSDDLGKWGKHLFPKMVEVLGNMKQGGKYSEFMSQIPSWPGLKNVQNVITLDFSDGNTFWDILKTTVPCIVQLFPPKSSFVHCLHMITSLQLERMQVALGESETYCENVEKQIVIIDANKEALAYIAMDVESYDNELKELKALYDDNHEQNNTNKELTAPIDNNHWRLGSPQQYLAPSEIILTGYKVNIDSFSRLSLTTLQIIPYKCVHIHYTSLEDWKVKKDIACCDPSFHGHPRYDCILLNTNPVSYGYGRLLFVFSLDMALKNCQGFEEKERSMIFLKYVVQACHMIPTFGGPDRMYYLNDMVDADMFLCCGK